RRRALRRGPAAPLRGRAGRPAVAPARGSPAQRVDPRDPHPLPGRAQVRRRGGRRTLLRGALPGVDTRRRADVVFGRLGAAAALAAARLLRHVAEQGGPLWRLLADLPPSVSTPEIRIPCPDERKFDVVARAARYFAARYQVSTLDGVRISFPDGWGLLRASNTQPVLVLRFEAARDAALRAYRVEVEDWLRAEGVAP